jgi:hypothetical protein
MIWISHRGNLYGKCHFENEPSQILNCLALDFDVEIDVWIIDNELYLGHDNPTYKINFDFIKKDKLWCHAKNIEALTFMLQNNIHCFWHEKDKYTITSRGFIWTYPTTKNIDGCIANQQKNIDFSKCVGVCADNICLIKSAYKIFDQHF